MFSLVANICILFSLVVILYEMVYQLSVGEGDEEAAIRRKSLAAFNLKSIPLYFGSAVYAFEGIGMVSKGLNIQRSKGYNYAESHMPKII